MHAFEHEPASDPPLTKAPRSVQRELRVKGTEEQVTKLTALLGPPAGLALRHKDAWDYRKVKIADTLGAKRSDTLGQRLRQVIEDPHHHAQVAIDTQKYFGLGYFRDWQELHVDNAERIESQAPGAGVALAIHEIWENYQSWVLGAGHGQSRYGPAHASAVNTVENASLTEIHGQSRRVAAAAGGLTKPSVVDYETYYLAITPVKDVGLDAARLGRRSVATVARQDFDKNSAELSEAVQDAIRDAVEEHLRRKLATAKVTGWRTADEEATVSQRRADAVVSYIIGEDLLDEDEDPHKGMGANVGSRQAWSDDGGVRETPGVTITIEAPEGL